MPLVHDPEDPKGGPGSSLLSTTMSSKVRRRRKKKAPPQEQPQQGLIGQDLLDWQDEAEDVESPAPIKPSLKTSKKKKKAAASNAAEHKPKRPKKKKASPQENAPEDTSTSNKKPQVTPLTILNAPLLTGGFASPITPAPRVRHALAVDTRALDTEEGMAVFHNIRQHTLVFLSALSKRGAAPCVVACSTQAQSAAAGKKSPRGGNARAAIQATAMQTNSDLLSVMEQGGNDSLLQPVPIRPPVNAKNVNRKAVLVPKRMLAHDSWKLFGDLVEAVVKEDQQVERSAHSVIPPLDVTVLTNDVSFLCDTKPECHKRGLNRFWERTRPFFENNSIRSVEIVVAETGTVLLSNADAVKSKADKDGGKNKKDVADETAGEDDVGIVDGNQKENNADVTNKVDENESVDGKSKEEMDGAESLEDNHEPSKHEVASKKCIESIKAGLSTRAEADYKKTRASEDPPSAVVVDFASISNSRLGYHTLVQKWLNELLALARDKGTISFELPESFDGMQCAMSLEATYKVFPFRADSLPAAGAMRDLQLLTQSKFEVIKLIPLSEVDGTLVFGQPMVVHPKLESDLAQYTEMKALVGSMLQFLSEKDLALVLHATDAGDIKSPSGYGLYHEDGQTFLLMAADLPCLSLMGPSQSQSQPEHQANGDLPSWGMLARYATAEQLLDSNCGVPSKLEGCIDSIKELSDCVRESLESMEIASTNPVLDYAMRDEKESPSETSPTDAADEGSDASSLEDVPWTDNDGVGARVAKAKANNPADEPMYDLSDSDDSMNDDWNAFSYD